MENSFHTQRKPQTEINPPQQHPSMQKTRKIIFTVALHSTIFINKSVLRLKSIKKKEEGQTKTTKLATLPLTLKI